MRCLLVLFSVAVAFAAHPELDGVWEQYKADFNKQYSSEAVEKVKREIFEFHYEYIMAHNAEYAQGKQTYTMGLNQFTDMHNDEFRAKMNGYKYQGQLGQSFIPEVNVGDLPTQVDWRTKGYVTPVKDQKQCGSCWAFSATGSMEGAHFKKTGQLVSLSEQNLVDCSMKEGNHGCGGGLMDLAFKYVIENHGIDTEASYPYTAMNGQCHYDAANIGATISSFVDITKDSEEHLQEAVATIGPVSVAIDAGHMSFQHYKEGVYSEPMCSSTRLDHGVLAVGYGSHQGDDYWLVKNSWGEVWGMQGYIWMSRNKHNQCGIASAASYPVV